TAHQRVLPIAAPGPLPAPEAEHECRAPSRDRNPLAAASAVLEYRQRRGLDRLEMGGSPRQHRLDECFCVEPERQSPRELRVNGIGEALIVRGNEPAQAGAQLIE